MMNVYQNKSFFELTVYLCVCFGELGPMRGVFLFIGR